jgi:hypothetical protein
VWCECPNCGATEEFGWDEPPPEVRAAILRDQGEARLTLDRFEDGFRLPLLRVFREAGNSLDDARRRVEAFVADGIVGTGPEMALYALRMRKHGLPVTVDPDLPVI